MYLNLTEGELSILADAMRELLAPSSAAAADTGIPPSVDREQAQTLSAHLARCQSVLALSHTGAGHDEWLAEFGSIVPSTEVVLQLADAAVGPDNLQLRQALNHYGTIRALAPGWLAAIADDPIVRGAIARHVLEQMQLFLR
jgi:hypothetical protein